MLSMSAGQRIDGNRRIIRQRINEAREMIRKIEARQNCCATLKSQAVRSLHENIAHYEAEWTNGNVGPYAL